MKILFRKSVTILLILVAIFTFFAFHINQFSLDASSESLLLDDDIDFKYYKKLRKQYGSSSNLVISYQTKDVALTNEKIQNLTNFVNQLKKIKQVKNITSILNVPLFASPKISLIDLSTTNISINNGNANLKLAVKEFQQSPIYANNLVSHDGKTSAILVALKDNNQIISNFKEKIQKIKLSALINKDKNNQIDNIKIKIAQSLSQEKQNTKDAIASIRNVITKNQDKAKIFLGGIPLISNDIIAYIGSDLVIFSALVIVIMMVVLFMLFKNIRFVIMPIAIGVISALMMTGILSFMHWKITVISSNFFSLLLVMTLSIMIHLIVRYLELSKSNKSASKKELIIMTIEQMFKPCLYTTLTTIIAFISLIVSDIRPVIDFGYIMAIGVSISFILSFISFAILMNLLPVFNNKFTLISKFSITKNLAIITQKYGKFIIVTSIILAIIAIYGISKITVDNRFIDYFKQDTEISQGLKLIDKELGGTISLEIILNDYGDGYWYNSEVRENIAKIHNYLESIDATGKVLSIETFIKMLSYINDDNTPSGFLLNIIISQMPDAVKKAMISPYYNENNGQLRFMIRIHENSKTFNHNELINNIKQTLIDDFAIKQDKFRLNGMMVLYNNMLQSLFDSQIKTIGLVFLMIFIMFFILFRSLSIAIIAIVPNMLPSLLILGIMGILSIPLDLMTITIASIAIGIGVDNAIHYIQRFKVEFARDNNYIKSINRSHESIGVAMFYTAITVAIGFMVLIFSNFIPSIYFGIFTAIAMLSAVILNLTLLPKLLILFKPKI